MRTDISFTSHGLTCRGWLYRPANAEKAPAIVMSHGLSAVKELGLTGFAETFCAAGFVVVVFDYRFQGDSDGAERGRIIPQEQHDDIRAAVGYTAGLPGVDAERIGYWGSSYSGGHALFLGAFEPRIKVVVSQVPAIALARAPGFGRARRFCVLPERAGAGLCRAQRGRGRRQYPHCGAAGRAGHSIHPGFL
jgi:cephalosporin-C deacetylase-like acetyl esterase